MAPEKNLTALGIDIGGTHTKVGLVDRTGSIREFHSFPTRAFEETPQPFLDRLSGYVHPLLASVRGSCMGIGISTHGYIDTDRRGPIVCRNTPSLKGFDLCSWAENEFKMRTLINNDLIAHALAEYYFGSGIGTRRFMCMAIGTGFGVGVINDGHPLRLVGGTTGDAGRIILEPGGIKCNYGVGGSVEALVGVSNIERIARERYGHHVPANEVITHARLKSDPLAIEIMQLIGGYLGHALATLSAIFLPEKVALTGGTAEAGKILLEACRKRFYELSGDYHQLLRKESEALYQGTEIVLGKNRGESGLLGSVVEFFPTVDKLNRKVP